MGKETQGNKELLHPLITTNQVLVPPQLPNTYHL